MISVTDDRPSHPVWFLPTVADLVFLTVVLLALRLGQTALLNDPGTPWHVRVGMDVWSTGPPREDAFSFTRAGRPWISQHWLCDAALALVHRAWSWDALVAASVLVLGWTYRCVFRTALDSGANVAWAAALALLAAGCAAPHWLARPHLLSVWFLALTFRWCLDYHRSGSRTIWAVPVVMAVWCNVHGAFLAGWVVVGCSLVGQLLSVPRDAQWRRRVAGFAAVLATAAAATLLNPYGWNLHVHLGDILFTSQVRDLIDEWRAPDFQLGESRPLELLLLLGLVLLVLARRRPNVFSLLHLVVWVHFGLLAVRQVAFLGVMAAPVLAGMTAELGPAIRSQLGAGRWFDWIEQFGRRASDWAAAERLACWPLWSAVASAVLVLVTLFGIRVPVFGIGTAHLSAERFPIQAVERLNSEPATGPLFHDLNWGGYLILTLDPPRRVFADDRFELYGREFLAEYLDALNYGGSWEKLLDRYHFEHVLIAPEVPLARVLRASPDWEVLFEDRTAILFRVVIRQ